MTISIDLNRLPWEPWSGRSFPFGFILPPTRVQQAIVLRHLPPSWNATVAEAVEEWADRIPLEIVARPELADITIDRQRPPPQRLPNGDIRARSALTEYQLYVRSR